ncbi:MAG: glutamate--tRNA ligase [Acidobacteria bacterium]|nr:glutamate--tRNA ligase [Acidobacteriota bacterium]
MTYRVRFAPSPTGELHVGGARTAVFNWLFARSKGGKFLLRIEDTDRERSSEAMTGRILEGLRWLGIDWDEDPLFQSSRLPAHLENVDKMMASGNAYRCFCDPEKLAAEREEALKSGANSWKYPGYCRDLDENTVKTNLEKGLSFSVRFKIPEGETSFNDLVHGETVFDNSNIDDFIIVRSDGTPTYQLSVVSDDIEMKITHVIRGNDHISNTPKQILIYKALGKDVPEFGHIPLILGQDKKRLSKRHGATSLIEYKERGYLPEAMFNFLSLLGWSPGNDREYLRKDELIKIFSLDKITKSGAVFDEQKLAWLNGQFLSDLPAEEIIEEIKPRFETAGLWDNSFQGERKEWFYNLINLLKTRCRILDDFITDAGPYLTDHIHYDDNGVKKHLKNSEVIEHLSDLLDVYSEIKDFNEANTEDVLRKLAEKLDISAGKLIHPLRMALVGVPVSPGVFEVAVLMGKEKTLERIRLLVEWLKSYHGVK